MFKDDERALAIERTAVAYVRIDLVKLALWCDWLDGQDMPAKSLNQAVSTALSYMVDLLIANGKIIKTDISLSDAVMWLNDRGLLQRGMMGKKKRRLGTFMAFENMRLRGEDPRHTGIADAEYATLHGSDEKTVMPLDVYREGRIEDNGPEEKKTYNERKVEKLTEEDKNKLIEIWNDMSEEEQAVFQRTPYRTEQERIDAFMMFYPRFRGDYPKEYENATTEVCLSDEYQEWMNEYFSKRDGFLWAMKGFIPEKAALRKRLEFDKDGVVKNVPTLGYDVSPEMVEETRKKEEAQKALATLEKEQQKLQKAMVKEEMKKREKLGKLEDKASEIKDEITNIKQLLEEGEDHE